MKTNAETSEYTRVSKLLLALLTLTAIAVMLALFVAPPKTAYAADTTVTIAQSKSEEDIQAEINQAVSNAKSGDTITITGSKTNATNSFTLYTKPGVRIIWKATYWGNSSTLIDLTNNHAPNPTLFEVADGSINNAGTGSAIRVTGENQSIIVSGGTIGAVGGYAIYSEFASTVIAVSGGTVRTTHSPFAIFSMGLNSSVIVSGGIVGCGGVGVAAIMAMHISVSGAGRVESEGNYCAIYTISKDSTVQISGGVVASASNLAIYCENNISTVTISGGFVFARGDRISVFWYDDSGAIRMISGTPVISGNGIVCTWYPPALAPVYDEGSSTDLTIEAASAAGKATWGKNGTQAGIYYANGSNTGFLPISGSITISTPAPDPTPTPTPTPNPTPSPDGSDGGDKPDDGTGGADKPNTPDGSGNTNQPSNGSNTSNNSNSNSSKDNDKSSSTWLWVISGTLAVVALGGGTAAILIMRRRS